MSEILQPHQANETLDQLHVISLGWSPRLLGALNRAGNRNTKSLTVLKVNSTVSDIESFSDSNQKVNVFGEHSIIIYDSSQYTGGQAVIDFLNAKDCRVFDMDLYEKSKGPEAIAKYIETHPAWGFGGRKIQCLHETGRAGARYGIDLLKQHHPKGSTIEDVNAIILGYGNVGMGALDECHRYNIRAIHILTRRNTAKEKIDAWLKNADLIINGAEQSEELRGHNFLVTNKHLKYVIKPKSVLIDLIGGSPTNRSPVEPVLDCTFLTNPYFVQDEIYVSSLWGWPMMGFMRETAIKYSGQMVDVLIGKERLIDGLEDLHPGVAPALVCGPFPKA